MPGFDGALLAGITAMGFTGPAYRNQAPGFDPFMIVASPCGVVLATMPPLLCAIANAGCHGVLVKSAVVMERLGMTTQVAFDKTGTLTEGKPQVDAVVAVSGSASAVTSCWVWWPERSIPASTL